MGTGLALETDVSSALRSCLSFSYGLPVSERSAAACEKSLGLAVLRLAVNLARFTKTRVCLSCFGSTNFGTRLFTKTQICSSCFGSANLGHSASFQFSDGLLNEMFLFGCLLPLSHSLISIVQVHLGSYDCCLSHRVRTPLIRCASPMSPISRLSHPFHLPVPRNLEFVAAANLFLNLFVGIIA